MARVNEKLRGVRGQARRDYLSQTDEKLDGFLSHDSQAFDDGFLSEKYRPSASKPGVPEPETRALDAMLDEYGLPRILKSLRELCDGRGSGGDFLESFEAEESRDEWGTHADSLERLLAQFGRES